MFLTRAGSIYKINSVGPASSPPAQQLSSSQIVNNSNSQPPPYGRGTHYFHAYHYIAMSLATQRIM